MTVTFCTSAAVKLKAGRAVSSSLSDSDYTMLINQAESYINDACKIDGVNLVSLYSTLDTDKKKILEDAASSHAAMAAIAYDMDGYSSASRVQTLLDVNYTRITDCINLLKDKKTTDFIGAS